MVFGACKSSVRRTTNFTKADRNNFGSENITAQINFGQGFQWLINETFLDF